MTSVWPPTGTFRQRYELAIGSLLGTIPHTRGLSEATLARAEKRLEVRFPAALRDYYLVAGKLRRLNEAHNQLFPPKDCFLDSGHLVFMAENQWVLYWGVVASSPPDEDPPVFQGVNHLPESIEWHPEGVRCSEFFLVMLHMQAVMGGFDRLATADFDAKLVEHFEQGWRRVGTLGGLVAYSREGAAACVLGDTESRELYVGASTKILFGRIEAELKAIGIHLNHL